jgi:hypothetical protein
MRQIAGLVPSERMVDLPDTGGAATMGAIKALGLAEPGNRRIDPAWPEMAGTQQPARMPRHRDALNATAR